MGTPPGIPGYELGIPCAGCLNFDTPKRFLAIVDGVKACPGKTDNPNGFFTLSQTAACQWKYSSAIFNYTYISLDPLFPGGSNFLIGDIVGKSWFTGFIPVICKTSFTNDHVLGSCAWNISGYDGIAVVFYGPGI